jgi:hypothetical protein
MRAVSFRQRVSLECRADPFGLDHLLPVEAVKAVARACRLRSSSARNFPLSRILVESVNVTVFVHVGLAGRRRLDQMSPSIVMAEATVPGSG